jgi:hypothetical protein
MAIATGSARAAAREMRSRAIPTTAGRPPARVVWALARVEAWKTLRHPAYVAAFGVSLLLTGGMGSEFRIEIFVLGLGIALVLGTLFAANLNALRSRRDGTDELFGSAPAPLAARTAAHLTTVWLGPVVASCAWVVLVALLALLVSERFPDDFDLALLAQGPLAVAAIGSLGVMTARWIPHVVGGAIVLALHMFTPLLWGLPWVVDDTDPSTYLWHLTYLASAIVVFSSAAFLRDRFRALPALTLSVGLAVAVVAGFLRVPDGGW